jgi:hypothetical protein
MGATARLLRWVPRVAFQAPLLVQEKAARRAAEQVAASRRGSTRITGLLGWGGADGRFGTIAYIVGKYRSVMLFRAISAMYLLGSGNTLGPNKMKRITQSEARWSRIRATAFQADVFPPPA